MLFTCKHADVCSFPPFSFSTWFFFKLCVVSRCPSDGDKENERGLDIISIEMSLLSMALLWHSLSAGSSHCTTFSTCKWQCHQMLSFHQSSRGGHEYTKGKAETGCLPQLYLAQLYRLSFLLWASTFCFSLKGAVLRSPRLNQGRSRILDLSSGLQTQVKCGHQMSSFFYIISAGGQRQQGSALHLLFLHAPPATVHVQESYSLPKHQTRPLGCRGPPPLLCFLCSSLLAPFFTPAVRSW